MSTAKTVVSVKDLSVQRGGAIVLEGVNLEIRAGDFVGLSGPNGSGKSTLLLTIIGELEPELGSVTVFGDKPGGPASRGRIAWISQAASQIPSNLRISVRELVSLGTTTSTNYLWPFVVRNSSSVWRRQFDFPEWKNSLTAMCRRSLADNASGLSSHVA